MKSQAAVLERWWPEQAEWFVIGGPADENEAQWVRWRYGKAVRCLGAEPNPDFHARQLFGRDLIGTAAPFPGELVHAALWRTAGLDVTLTLPGGAHGPRAKCGSICRPEVAPDMGGRWEPAAEYAVRTTSLDYLDSLYGPLHNVVLWLDVEYAELKALEGGTRLLDRVLLVNVETYPHGNLPEVEKLLNWHGLRRVHEWNQGPDPYKDAVDYVFARS